MRVVEVEESHEFEGLPARVFDLIADYEVGHPSILPKKYFPYLEVEEGGYGAGTVIRYGVKLGGRVQEARARIVEPEPGRVLEEHIFDDRGTVTSFTVDPVAPGRVGVTIGTRWCVSGIRGLVEQLVAPVLLSRIYRLQLAAIEAAGGSRRQP